VREIGHSEVDLGVPCRQIVDLGEFLLGSGEADLEPFDFTEPAFALGFGDAGQQVVTDLEQARALGRVRTEQGAAQAPLTEPNAMFEQVAADSGRLAANLSA
jgi:hypothetical protein